MKPPLRILLLEDDAVDAELILTTLAKAHIDCGAVRVETQVDFVDALEKGAFDLILSDHTLPSFDGLSALNISRGKSPDVPFIFVTGSIGEELAIDTFKMGATDYVLKQRLSRLVPAVRRAIAEVHERALRQGAERSRAEAESLSRALFDQVAVGVAIVDLNGRIAKANATLQVMLGYEEGEISQVELAHLAHPEDASAGTGAYEELLEGRRTSFVREKRFVRRDGAVLWGREVVSLIRGDDGVPRFSVNMIEDISERKELEQRLLQAKEMKDDAETANRAKGVFLSTMSHEIRTPMNAILGYTQLIMRDSSLGPETKANLNIIHRSGEHLLDIINDVLDTAKIDAGRMELIPSTFNFSNFLRDLTGMFRLRAAEKALRFEVVLDGEPVPYVVADEGKMRQVLINMIGNAVKFTERGQITVRVSVKHLQDHQLWLSAEVEDTGVGLTAEEQTKLFQPFAQSNGGLNLHQGGTGLGLAISRRFAQLMGGDIAAYSRAGGGMVFRFEVPIERGSAGDFRAEPTRGRVIGIQPGGEIPRVLIVDDAPENRDWLGKLLRSIGFSVREANDGEAAIRTWDEWNPQLILMDLHMPVMDGLAAMRTIKATGKATLVIFLTASAMVNDRQVAFDHGADDFISSPCREDELLTKIQTHLGITYVYAEETASNETAAAAAMMRATLSPEELRQLPPDLIIHLLSATMDGNKADLNKLILKVEESGSSQSARGLQELADNYEYDRLIQLLEKAGQ